MTNKSKKSQGRPVVKIELYREDIDEIKASIEANDPIPSDVIRNVRNGMGITQAQFAESTGTTTRTVQEWESGRRNCTKSARMMVASLATKLKAVG